MSLNTLKNTPSYITKIEFFICVYNTKFKSYYKGSIHTTTFKKGNRNLSSEYIKRKL